MRSPTRASVASTTVRGTSLRLRCGALTHIWRRRILAISTSETWWRRARDVGIAAGADRVNVIPGKAAARLLEGGARVEHRRDLKGLEEAALRTVLANQGVRIVGDVAVDHAMANAVREDLAYGADDLVERAVR